MYRFENLYEESIEAEGNVKAQENLNEAIKAAQKCLTHGDFHKYKEAYQKSYDGILDDMLTFTQGYLFEKRGSLELYAVQIIRYMQKIQDLKVLLNKVNADASKNKVATTENSNVKEQ